MLHNEPDAAQARIDSIAQRYARALGSEARDFAKAAEAARCRLAAMAAAMNLQVDGESPARRLLALPDSPQAEPSADSLLPHALQATVAMTPRPEPANTVWAPVRTC